ncbi:hypothetical protein BE21_54945 [Sorangium cellulosum]|uniref:VWFC domain-containing protein n=1 Tax=Sorangium cellulosum TaxID=56 RepID=A0A150TCQ1_SORCE|nr:hypothetical protein BE21_54945 [Sorangium cellulosum]
MTGTWLAVLLALSATAAGCGRDDAGAAGSGSGDRSAGGGSCTYAGRAHAQGEEFPAGDGCNTCRCEHGALVCTTVACESCWHGDRWYRKGEQVNAREGCRACSCASEGDCRWVACADAATPR